MQEYLFSKFQGPVLSYFKCRLRETDSFLAVNKLDIWTLTQLPIAGHYFPVKILKENKWHQKHLPAHAEGWLPRYQEPKHIDTLKTMQRLQFMRIKLRGSSASIQFFPTHSEDLAVCLRLDKSLMQLYCTYCAEIVEDIHKIHAWQSRDLGFQIILTTDPL